MIIFLDVSPLAIQTILQITPTNNTTSSKIEIEEVHKISYVQINDKCIFCRYLYRCSIEYHTNRIFNYL
jgi:hypothetical protein